MYRIGFGYERESSEALVRWQVKRTIETICDRTGASDYGVYITSSDKSNFRFTVDPTYKATRTKRKPKWYDVIREDLEVSHSAHVVTGMEADDKLAIDLCLQRGLNQDCTLASIDKDLLQVAGLHYNFVKDKFVEVTEIDGHTNLCTQLLTGDRIDNVRGLAGYGPKTAKRILEKVSGDSLTPHVLYHTVYKEYVARHHKEAQSEFVQNLSLLYLLREENDSAQKMLVSKAGWKMDSEGNLKPYE